MNPMKALSILALIAGFSAPALAEPAPAKPAQVQIMAGPGDGAAGPLNAQENNSTYQQIQSPRDPASGQATARNAPTSTGDQPEMTLRNTATGVSANFDAPKLDADSGLEIVSPRDAASGLATGRRTYEPVVQQGNLNSAGTETANTGQWIGGTDDGQSIRKPRPNKRQRKGRRMHKP